MSKVLCTVTIVIFHPTLEGQKEKKQNKKTHLPTCGCPSPFQANSIGRLLHCGFFPHHSALPPGCSETPQRLRWPPLQRTQPLPSAHPCSAFSCRCSTSLHLVFNIMLHLLGVEQRQMINILRSTWHILTLYPEGVSSSLHHIPLLAC